jgi:CubicO group peptidase (beta-lactamase class C family)
MLKRLFYSWVLVLLISTCMLPQEKHPADSQIILTNSKHFSDKDHLERDEAIKSIVKQGKAAVDPLLQLLADKNDDVRLCTVIALSKIAPEGAQAIPFLIEALRDKNSDVRWCSAVTLGKFKEKAASAVLPLLDVMNDTDRDVRLAAYTSLLKINKESINQAPDFSTLIKIIEDITPQLMKELRVPGVSISLIKDYKPVWSKGFGFADVAEQKAVNNKTIFEACSMSKPVFAYIVLKLVEQGRLELDKPLYDYLPEDFVCDNDDYAKLITARMALTHTTGMPNWRNGGEETEGPIPLYFKPGTKFSYSGEGIFYLQRVVEHITGESLDVYAKRELFDKLGFVSTGYNWTPKLDPQISRGHDTSGAAKTRSNYKLANAAYTLYTTPDEYAAFIIELMKHDNSSGVSLTAKMAKEMTSHQILVDTREVTDRPGRALGLFSFRGLGWGIDSTVTGNIIYHSGSNQSGFRCYSQFNMNEGNGIVIMTNGANGSELWTQIIRKVGDL